MRSLLALDSAQNPMGSWIIIVYVVLIGAMMYFMIIKPQKKQKKEQAALMNSMEIGDSLMTTAGFYGVIIDMTDDTVIVEFGTRTAASPCRSRRSSRSKSLPRKSTDPSP